MARTDEKLDGGRVTESGWVQGKPMLRAKAVRAVLVGDALREGEVLGAAAFGAGTEPMLTQPQVPDRSGRYEWPSNEGPRARDISMGLKALLTAEIQRPEQVGEVIRELAWITHIRGWRKGEDLLRGLTDDWREPLYGGEKAAVKAEIKAMAQAEVDEDRLGHGLDVDGN